MTGNAVFTAGAAACDSGGVLASPGALGSGTGLVSDKGLVPVEGLVSDAGNGFAVGRAASITSMSCPEAENRLAPKKAPVPARATMTRWLILVGMIDQRSW
jgi:hypothetical protein